MDGKSGLIQPGRPNSLASSPSSMRLPCRRCAHSVAPNPTGRAGHRAGWGRAPVGARPAAPNAGGSARVRRSGSATVQRAADVMPAQRGEKARIGCVRGLLALDIGVEVGCYLEQLGKLWVVPAEQVVDATVTDQNDLDVERDGLRLERDGAYKRQRALQRFDRDSLCAQRALQRLPCVGLNE